MREGPWWTGRHSDATGQSYLKETAMALFISYSSQDGSTVDALATTFDVPTNRFGSTKSSAAAIPGGPRSWKAELRACDVFIVALLSNWLQSKPSQSELRYAQSLNRPILPVRIGDISSMRVNPLAALQIIDYRDPTVDATIQLVTAVHSLVAKPQPLPDPLPKSRRCHSATSHGWATSSPKRSSAPSSSFSYWSNCDPDSMRTATTPAHAATSPNFCA